MQNGIHIIIELVHLFFSPNFTVEVLKNCNGKLSWRSKIAGKSFVARNSNLTSNSPFEQFKKWKWNQKIWWWTPYQGGNVLLFRLRSFFLIIEVIQNLEGGQFAIFFCRWFWVKQSCVPQNWKWMWLWLCSTRTVKILGDFHPKKHQNGDFHLFKKSPKCTSFYF